MKTFFSSTLLMFLLLLLSCDNSSNPDIKISGRNIEIDNFPDIFLGRTGINSVDWTKEYNFEKLNQTIFKLITENARNLAEVEIIVYLDRQGSYGNKTKEQVSIGAISVIESLKYTDYSNWRNYYNIERIAKDKLHQYWLNK